MSHFRSASLLHPFLFVVLVATFSRSSQPVCAQGTLEDYHRAYSLSHTFTWAKVKDYVDDARWLPEGRFQYHLTDGGQGRWHFGQVTPDGTIILADTTSSQPIESQHSGTGQWQRQGRDRHSQTPLRFIANPSKRRHERHWMETDDERSADPVLSPDSSLVAFIRNDNVYIARPDGSQAHPLTNEGTLSHYFSSYIQWSPDGRYLFVCRIRPVEKRYVYYVESSPVDQLQPILHKQEYAKPGDELPQRTPYIIEVATGKVLCADNALFPNQYSLDSFRWNKTSDAVTFEYNERGHKAYRVLEMSATNGQVRTLIEEQFSTYVNYSAYHYRYDFEDGQRILWMSERDGYAHLYLRTRPADGKKSRSAKSESDYISTWLGDRGVMTTFQVTRGSWVVRRVLKVDEEKGLIYFTACGRNEGEDPYNIHYYRIKLDGTGLTDLTPAAGNHRVQFNEDYTTLIDTWSTPSEAPQTCITNTATGKSTLLGTASIDNLQAAGWVAPEVFVAPGRDGTTPMWGIIQRPTNFDPTRKYPVIEYIYSGPGDAYTPKSFMPFNHYTSAISELGFIVVQLDAMGTSHRGKKFEEVCHKNLKDAGFPDRIAWLKAAAAKYPYMDINNVGIYGCSAGGQESTAAVLFHGDFYKAAYSACGCHDNRMDKIWWNEQWMGYPVDSSYIACSNVENAYRLQRPLMLVVCELDDNVDPASTMQVANALIKANKPFELVVIPGAHHTVGETYGEHKRYDFFVKHLLGIDPPSWEDVGSQK